MEQSWYVRKYEDGDEAQIIDLYSLVFKMSENMNYWTWKYKENPVGFKIYVAEDKKGRIVGHYGLILAKIKIRNKLITGSQAVEAMTHPHYQHQGMFVKLGKEILREAGAEGIPLTYGFPNELAMPGHRKVGWIEVCNIPILIKPLNIRNILRKYIHHSFLLNVSSYLAGIFLKIFIKDRKMQVKGLSANHVSSFDERADDFWYKVADDYNLIQVRNREFLNWRYVKNPDKQYNIFVAEKSGNLLGYIVLGEMVDDDRKGGVVVDILTYLDRGEISDCLISKAMEYFEAKDVDYVVCLMRKGNIYYKSLKRHGFITIPKRTRFIVHINSDNFSKSLSGSLDQWFFTWGDSDYM